MSAPQQILLASSGWLELGNHLEAHNELEKLPHNQRATSGVLKLRCRIYRQAEKWDYLSILAESCSSAHPQEAQFLIDWAWAEYRQGRKEKAAVVLLHESRRFPQSEALAYDLAIMLASLNRMAEARDWLAKAFELADDPEKLKLRALEQVEFEKIWREGKPQVK